MSVAVYGETVSFPSAVQIRRRTVVIMSVLSFFARCVDENRISRMSTCFLSLPLLLSHVAIVLRLFDLTQVTASHPSAICRLVSPARPLTRLDPIRCQFHAQLLHSHTHSSPINVRLASPTAPLLYCPRTSVSSPAEALGTFPTPTADARVVAILLSSLFSLSPGHSAVASFQSRLCDGSKGGKRKKAKAIETGPTAEPLNSS